MITNIKFIELTKATWPKDISPSSQAWLTDKLNETLDRLKYLQQDARAHLEQQQTKIEILTEDLAIMTGNYKTHAQINEEHQAKIEQQQKCIRALFDACKFIQITRDRIRKKGGTFNKKLLDKKLDDAIAKAEKPLK